MVNEQRLHIHPPHKSRPRDQKKRRALGTRIISGYFDTILERQKRESLEAAIQTRIIDM